MVFSSFFFLFFFLPFSLFSYHLTPNRFKNYSLLALSILFYAWGAPQVIHYVLLSCLADFHIGRQLTRSVSKRKLLLAIGLILNLGLLFYFKYANFFLTQINLLVGSFGASPLEWQGVVLPIGISFFTFHKISYLVDVYRGTAEPAVSIGDYFLYILFFPQLIAGPIIRYHDINEQLRKRALPVDEYFYGVFRFCTGLAKKVLIADPLGAVADTIFKMSPETLPVRYAWLGILSYSFQIYFDFSGYSDMALGLARFFGFRIVENFNRPYLSRNFTEFWRRWHISLSNFMREYLYISLGGNRGSTARTYLNLWIVFLASGLWHGAAWNFIAWGIFHGTFLAVDKCCWLKISSRVPKVLNIALTFFMVTMGWVFFRADTLTHAVQLLKILFCLNDAPYDMPLAAGYVIHFRAQVVFVLAWVLTFYPDDLMKIDRLKISFPRLVTFAQGAAAITLFFLSSAALASAGYTPFLYFRF